MNSTYAPLNIALKRYRAYRGSEALLGLAGTAGVGIVALRRFMEGTKADPGYDFWEKLYFAAKDEIPPPPLIGCAKTQDGPQARVTHFDAGILFEALRTALINFNTRHGWGSWSVLSDKTGIPLQTITRIAYGQIKSPKMANWWKLHNAFPVEIPSPAANYEVVVPPPAPVPPPAAPVAPALPVELTKEIALLRREIALLRREIARLTDMLAKTLAGKEEAHEQP